MMLRLIVTHSRRTIPMISLTLTEKDWDDVIDALNTISWKYDDTNCDKISENLTTQLTQHLEAKV